MSRTVLSNDWYGTYIEVAQVDFVLIPLQLLSRLEPLPSTTPSQLTEEVDYGLHHQIVTTIAKDIACTTPPPRLPSSFKSPVETPVEYHSLYPISRYISE
jgi:hypothetical protein